MNDFDHIRLIVKKAAIALINITKEQIRATKTSYE